MHMRLSKFNLNRNLVMFGVGGQKVLNTNISSNDDASEGIYGCVILTCWENNTK